MVGNIIGGCLFESVLTIWCSSLLADARAILSVLNLYLAVCTGFETMRFACMYKSLKMDNFVFVNFLSAWRHSLLAMKTSSVVDSSYGEKLWVIAFRIEGGTCLHVQFAKVTELVCLFNRWKHWNTWKFSNKWWAVNVSNVPNSPV